MIYGVALVVYQGKPLEDFQKMSNGIHNNPYGVVIPMEE
jgi:hypothetical protein